MKSRIISLGVLALGTALPLTAQSISDDFSTSTNWSILWQTVGNDVTSVANGRLEYTVNSGTTKDLAGRYFAIATGSYTSDWSVQVDVHLDSLSLTGSQYANLNLAVMNSTHLGRPPGSGSSMMDVAIDRFSDSGTTVRGFESSLNSFYSGTDHYVEANMNHATGSNTTDATLRISFNSATKELTSWYDTNGAVGGYNWVALQTINIGSGEYTWEMGPGSTFWIVLAGGSGADSGAGIAFSSGKAYFDNFLATGLTAPGITAQPLARTVNAGQNASFAMTGVGPGTLSYQWEKNRVNLANGGKIDGATSAALTVNNAQLADIGYYIGVVTNSAGSVPSEKAALNLTSIPIATSAQAESSVSAAFDGTNYLVGIQGDTSAYYDVTAQRVSPAGTLVGSRISTGRTGGVPWVAFGGTHYLMVWEDDALYPINRLYGAFVSPNGTIGSAFAFPVRSGASSRQAPQGIAFDGTNYLVIYSDGQAEPFNLCGRFVSPSGTIGNEFVLATNAADAFQPAAWNGSTYFVAWPAHIGGNQNIVQGRTVSKAGAMSDLITIDATPSVDQNPVSVATDGSNFLVAWNYDASVDSNGDPIWALRGRVITPAGGFLTPQFTIADTTNRPIFPAIAFDGANYLATWTWRHEAGDLDVAGRYFTPLGKALGDGFALAIGDGNQGVSPVVAGGGKVLVAWTDGLGLDDFSGGDVRGLILPGAPTFTIQPTDQTVTAGGNASFTAAASGVPAPTYQWQRSTDNGSTWSNLTNTTPYGGTTTGTLTITGATSVQAGNLYQCLALYSVQGAAASNAAALLFNKAAQTVTFPAPGNKVYGSAPFNVSGSATSGLPVTFSVVSGPATIAGRTVTLTGTGLVTLRASQAGNANYNAATSVDHSFSVVKAAQTVTFPAPGNKVYGSAPFNVSGSATSGLPLTFSVVSGPATIAGRTVTLTGTGLVTLRASQAGNANYNAATSVDHSFSVVKAAQTVTFPAPGNKVYGSAPFNVSGSATSGLPVTFSVVSGPATISGRTVTLTGTGLVTLRASQAGNANYNAATSVDHSFSVVKAAQTVTFPAPGNKVYGSAPFNLSGSATSGLPVTFSVVSGPATIAGRTVTLTGTGLVTLAADQAGNANYNAAPEVIHSFTVN